MACPIETDTVGRGGRTSGKMVGNFGKMFEHSLVGIRVRRRVQAILRERLCVNCVAQEAFRDPGFISMIQSTVPLRPLQDKGACFWLQKARQEFKSLKFPRLPTPERGFAFLSSESPVEVDFQRAMFFFFLPKFI